MKSRLQTEFTKKFPRLLIRFLMAISLPRMRFHQDSEDFLVNLGDSFEGMGSIGEVPSLWKKRRVLAPIDLWETKGPTGRFIGETSKMDDKQLWEWIFLPFVDLSISGRIHSSSDEELWNLSEILMQVAASFLKRFLTALKRYLSWMEERPTSMKVYWWDACCWSFVREISRLIGIIISVGEISR